MRKFKLRLIDALAGLLLCLAVLSGALKPLDTRLLDWRFQILDRVPSDTLVVVGIDPRSLEEEERWPWSRALYARAIRNLKDAGAEVVAFDVDFSSRSDDEGDRLFRDALQAYPGEVLLPEFYQTRGLVDGSSDYKRTAPHPYFLDSAAIATVNLFVEESGVVRKGWCGASLDGAFRGSIAGNAANMPPGSCGSFLIDYAIDPARLTKLSFIDVERGDFDPAIVKGKQIFIGATALELGDEFATPIHGLLPGIILHALSYESLVQGRAIHRINDGPAIVVAFLLFALLVRTGASWSGRTLFLHALALTLALAAPIAVQAALPLSLNTAPLIAAQLLATVCLVAAEMKRRAKALLSQKLETLKHQELIALVVRDSSDGVIITDQNGRIEVCNRQAAFLLGADGDLKGSRLQDIAPAFPSLASEVHAATASTLSEHAVKSGDAERVLEIASACTSPQRSGWLPDRGVGEIYFAYSLRDVTARKAIEKAERDAKEAALAAASFKNQLISNMSHELRTPLNSIIGFSAILRDNYAGANDPDHQKYADYINSSGARLLRLVSDMMMLSQLDAGESSLAPDDYSMDELWENSLAPHRTQLEAEGKSVTVDVAGNFPTLHVDSDILSRALSHLISNAAKFTTAGGAILLRAASSANGIVIEVEDNGIGVSGDQLQKLGAAFSQGDASRQRGHEGAGLGLYVSRKCISLHGGTLDFESAPAKGFKAIIRLPASVARQPRAAALAS